MSGLRAVLMVLLGCGALADRAVAAQTPCTAKFGEVVDFAVCNPVRLPGLEVRFIDISQPNEGVPLSCWNYEASTAAGAVEPFRQCHTGELGGHHVLSVGGANFTVFFDAVFGCTRLPSGSWAPKVRGPAFFAGVVDAAEREAFWRRQSEAERRCFARRRE